MKLAFSTLGVPGMPVPDVARLAAESGFQGVELRAHPEEPVHPGIGLSERVDTVEEFKAAGVEILCVAGYVRTAEAGDDEPVIEELHRLLALARDLGAPYARVFPGGGEQSADEADATAARRLASVAGHASDLGVRLLLENHDSHRRGADTARVLGLVGHRNVGAIWDVMHSWMGGEEPAATHAVLAPHLGYVQVKDIASREDTTPLPLGQGVLPLAECLKLLTGAAGGSGGSTSRSEAGSGWLCWEYEKRWYPEVAELPELLGAARDELSLRLSGSA